MTKIKTVFFLLVFSIFINPVSAQLLWKVEGNGLQQLESPEVYFVGLANEDGREIIDLETAALQMGIFDEILTDLQMQEILRMLEQEGIEEFQVMKKAYLAEDLLAHKLERWINQKAFGVHLDHMKEIISQLEQEPELIIENSL